MERPSRQQLEEMVASLNAEARRKKGDEAERFFINDQGVVDMVNADGSRPDPGSDDECCFIAPGFFCEAKATFCIEAVGVLRTWACAAHLEPMKQRLAGHTLFVQPIH